MRKLLLSLGIAGLAMSAAAQKVYFEDDFEWLKPYAEAGKNGNGDPAAGNTIGTNGKETEAPKADACKVDGKSALEVMKEKGYDLVFAYQWDKDPAKPDIAVYLQNSYLKFNKTGNLDKKGYQCGLVLPKLQNIPAGTDLIVSFDWCPMKQGSGMFDKTQMAVIVENGDDTKAFDAKEESWEDNADYSWKTSTISLAGAKLDSDTKLIIRNTDAGWVMTSAHRFFLDNIKVYAAEGGSGVAEIGVEENAPVEYYNLQGIRVENPENGLYIVKQGNKVTKKVIR